MPQYFNITIFGLLFFIHLLNSDFWVNSIFIAVILFPVDFTSCIYNNVTYMEGAAFPAGDGCNNW